MTDLHDLSLAEIGARLRDGRLKAAALAEHAIARHERFGKPLNAYKHWAPAEARRAAEAADAAFAAGGDFGPLQGIPVSVKDLFGVAGMPIFGGSPRPLPKRFEGEGPVVAGLRRQGAVFTGKTHTVEFAYDGLGVNPHWCAPRNPWDAKSHRLPDVDSFSLRSRPARTRAGNNFALIALRPGPPPARCARGGTILQPA